jgi:hypothetical protein
MLADSKHRLLVQDVPFEVEQERETAREGEAGNWQDRVSTCVSKANATLLSNDRGLP